jgi:hypothetical protein
MEEGWEYNDETYFHPESGSGTPRKIFASHEAADKECDKRNVESFRELFTSGEAVQYFYNFNDIIPYESRKDREYLAKIESLSQKIFGLTIDDINEKLDDQEEVSPLPDASDADWSALLSLVNINFWDVVECEKE